jgi:hypothetical protein
MLLKAPLFAQLGDALYNVFAPRRTAVSIELGMAACGVEPPADAPKGYRDTPGAAGKAAVIPPARVLKNRVTGGVREALAAVFVVSLFVQTVSQNKLSASPAESGFLSSISWWTHTKSDWSILTPEPAADNAYMVLDAYTRNEASIDPLTGKEPKLVADEPFDLGPLWANYLSQIRLSEQVLYQPAFRTYVSKRGPHWPAEKPEEKLLGADAYWVVAPAGGGTPTQERLFRHGRGGKVLGELGAAEKPAPSRRVPVPGSEPGKVPLPRPTALPREE